MITSITCRGSRPLSRRSKPSALSTATGPGSSDRRLAMASACSGVLCSGTPVLSGRDRAPARLVLMCLGARDVPQCSGLHLDHPGT
jgi:hypothetical protein